MIQFFRKLRQNLLAEGRTSRYLKYALGEIVLVVIGILIAIQINNWNESKKQEKKLNIELASLLVGLGKDIEVMQGDMSTYKSLVSYLQSVHKQQFENLDPRVFLRNLVTNVIPRKHGNTYEKFKNHGALDQLPPELSLKLIYHYEIVFEHLHHTADFHKTFVLDHIESFILQNYKFEPTYRVDSLTGYQLMKDDRLYSYITYQEGTFGDYIKQLDEAIQNAEVLENEIEAYLKDRNDH